MSIVSENGPKDSEEGYRAPDDGEVLDCKSGNAGSIPAGS